MIPSTHRHTYREARRQHGAAHIRTVGFLGLSVPALEDLEADYQRTRVHAACKWCDRETSIPKAEAHVLGVACSEDCEREIGEHYT